MSISVQHTSGPTSPHGLKEAAGKHELGKGLALGGKPLSALLASRPAQACGMRDAHVH